MSSGTRAAQSAAACAQSAVGSVEIRRIWADAAAESGPEAKVGTVTGASFHPSYWSARCNGEHTRASEADTARTDEDDKKSLPDTPGVQPRIWKQTVEGRADKRVDGDNPDSVESNVDGHCGQEAGDQAHDDASRAPPSPEAHPLSPVEARRALEELKLPALPGSVKDVSLAPVKAAHGQNAATSASGAADYGNVTGDKGKGKQRAVSPAMIALDDSDDEVTLRNGQNVKGGGREESPDSSTPTSSDSSPLRSSPAHIKPLGPGWRDRLATVLRLKAQAPTYEIGPQSSSDSGSGPGYASPFPSSTATYQQQEGNSVGTPNLDPKAPAFIPSHSSASLHTNNTSGGASTTKLNPKAAPFVPAAMRQQQASNDVPSDSETICPRNMPAEFDMPAMPTVPRLPRRHRRRIRALPTVATPETSDTSDASDAGQEMLVEAGHGDWQERLVRGLRLAPAMGTAMGIAPMETASNQSSIGDDSLPLDFNPESLLPDYYRRQAPRPLLNVQRWLVFQQPLQYGPQHQGPFRSAGNMWASGPRSVGQHTQQEPQHRGANVWDPYPQYLTQYPEPPRDANASAAAPGLQGNICDARVPPADAPYYGQGAMLPPPLDIPAAGLTPQDRLQLAASITAASRRVPPPPPPPTPSAYQALRSPRRFPQNPFIPESEILYRIQRFVDDVEPQLVAEMGGNVRQRFDAESRARLERVSSEVFREELMDRQRGVLQHLEQQTPQQRAMWVRQDASANAGAAAGAGASAGAGDANEAAGTGPYEM